jgi:hypothetical protein
MADPAKLATLRKLLAGRFPATTQMPGRVLRTGIPSIDDTAGGLPLGALTEIVCAAPSCGSLLLLGQILGATRAARTRVALVDASDSFDPASLPADHLAHLVWVRCATSTALTAADLLARDANLGLVILDLRRSEERDLRRTPATLWYRLQRAVEPADLALLVMTPGATVPSAQLLFSLDVSHDNAHLGLDRLTLSAALLPKLQRQRHTTRSAVA